MADFRMFGRSTVCSDEFIDMSKDARLLYVQCVFEADNFGFFKGITRIARSIGASIEAADELVKNRFLIRFESGVYALRYWNVSNGNYKTTTDKRSNPDGLQAYRTNFPKELAQVFVTEDLSYELIVDSTGSYEKATRDLLATQYNASSKQIKTMHHIYKTLHGQAIYMTAASHLHPHPIEPASEDEDDERRRHDNDDSCFEETGEKPDLRRYMENNASWITDGIWQTVEKYQMYYNMDDSLIRYAFEKTRESASDSPAGYFRTLLKDYQNMRYTTGKQAADRDEERIEMAAKAAGDY